MKKAFRGLFYAAAIFTVCPALSGVLLWQSLRVSGVMSAMDENTIDQRGAEREHRILVVGKAGNGKSSVCNTIVGGPRFTVGRGMVATTRTLQQEHLHRYGRSLRVVDTPDVSNLEMSQREMEEEVGRWREATRPYPTAVLLTVRCDVRYTAEEHAVYRQIQKLWGDNSLQQRLVVAFTFGDRQDEAIEEELKTVCPELQSVLRDAGHRYFVFSNKASDREEQAAQLLNYLDLDHTGQEPPAARRSAYLPRVLAGVSGVAGLCFAAAVTASKTGWAAGFGVLCLASGIAFVVFRKKRKTH